MSERARAIGEEYLESERQTEALNVALRNQERALHGRAALEAARISPALSERYADEEPWALADLIADLLHYADHLDAGWEGEDGETISARALSNYRGEREGDDFA